MQAAFATRTIMIPPPPAPDALLETVAVIAKTIKNAVASAAEAEVGALFVNAQLAAPMRTTPQRNQVALNHQPLRRLATQQPKALSMVQQNNKEARQLTRGVAG